MQKLRIMKHEDGTRSYYLLARVHGQYASAHVERVQPFKRKEEKGLLFEKVSSVLTFPPLF